MTTTATTVRYPESNYPTEQDHLAAALAQALTQWQGNPDAENIIAMRAAAAPYAESIASTFAGVPEVYAAADRVRYAVENDRPSVDLAAHVVNLFDLLVSYYDDEAADAASARHDAWRGTEFAAND